jgi:predicted nucleic acid-binding protein
VILVDTSVWVDFFRGADRVTDLTEHLESNLVLLHPWVLGELVLGGLGPRRKTVIADLKRLPASPLVPDEEVLELILTRQLRELAGSTLICWPLRSWLGAASGRSMGVLEPWREISAWSRSMGSHSSNI